VDFEFKEAMRTPAWWIIALTTTVRTTNNGVFQVHFIPIFVWKGFSELGAATMVGMTQLLATPLILLVGWLGDRWSKKAILVVAHVCLGLSLVVLTLVDSDWGVYVFVMLFAFGANVAPANYSIIGDYFGRKTFARLRGVLNSLGIIGMGTTVLAGWVFDATQSYGAFLLGTSAFSAAAAITVFTFLHKPVRKAQVEAVTS
jgi:MFS family permease